MVNYNNAKTAFKLCVCSKIFRSDAFKKHSCAHKRMVGGIRYFCSSHNASRLVETLPEWHAKHSSCSQPELTEEAKQSLFSSELKALETQCAIEAITSAKPPSSCAPAKALSPTPILEAQSAVESITTAEAPSSSMPAKALSPTPIESSPKSSKSSSSSSSDESATSSSDSEEEEEDKGSTKVDLVESVYLDSEVEAVRDVDLDSEVQPAKLSTSGGIAAQCRNFIMRPPLVDNYDKLKNELEVWKRDCFFYKASSENLSRVTQELKKTQASLFEKEGELDRERFSHLASKAKEEQLLIERESQEKELRKMREEVEGLRKQLGKVVATNQELHQQVMSSSTRRSSRLHIPLDKKGRVPARPLLCERGRDEMCYSRAKKGIECLHFTFDHKEAITGFLFEPRPEKICKFKTSNLEFKIITNNFFLYRYQREATTCFRERAGGEAASLSPIVLELSRE